MEKYYEKTKLRYLIVPAILILYLTTFSLIILNGKSYIYVYSIFCLAYLILIFLNVKYTLSERKDFREIVHLGQCRKGTVKELVEVPYEIYMGRFGIETSTRYQISVEVRDDFGNVCHTHLSDSMKKSACRYIPKQVFVYCYMGRTCIVWNKSKQKEKYPVVKGREVKGAQSVRIVLNTINQWLILVSVLSTFAAYYIVLEYIRNLR